MSWEDRLADAAYTPPSGERLLFYYENVTKSIDKKTSSHDFPDADGTYIQDNGSTGNKYPLRLYFWGDACDLEANVFEAALLEKGAGVLEHPVYGKVDVVPFGTIKRRDDLKDAANQVIIDVTFWQTTGAVYPSSQADPASAVAVALAAYNDAIAEEFEEVTSLDGAVEQAEAKSEYTSLLDQAKDGLQSIADTQADVQKQFDAVNDSINNAIDVLIGQPLTLAYQTAIMLQAPARALTSIKSKLSAYSDLASDIFGDGDETETSSNNFYINDLYAASSVTGSIVSVVNHTFETKSEALEAADDIIDQFDTLVEWRDENYQELGEIDTGSSYQALQESVALAAGFLVEISFSLKQERSIVLARPRTIIDLVAELYGAIDEELDFFIDSNNLTGDEILEVPRGREILYYV